MKSFVTIAVLLATFTGGSLGLPTGNVAVARRGEGFFFPLWIPPAPPAAGPISATGANGGFNYNGNGANGGGIDISKLPGGGAITANGANGGQNYNGNGANGGKISIGRREEDFFFPLWIPSAPPAANGPITATGTNGGFNYAGNGANGGSISVNKREEALEDSENFFFPLWIPAPPAANGPITASGANGGTNYFGNGANGGKISISSRAEESEDVKGFFFPLWIPSAPPAPNGPITANGANGGYNYGGSGANGGSISVST